MHSDIGGGYWFDGLSDITLQFMVDRVKGKLHVLNVNEIDYEDLKIKGVKGFICLDDLNIIPLLKGKLHQQQRSGLKAKTLAPRLVRVNVNDHPSEHIPIIHHTVSERFHTVTQYRPYALRNVTFNTMDESGHIDVNKNHVGITGLSESSEPAS